jgi:hypothetical protein
MSENSHDYETSMKLYGHEFGFGYRYHEANF